MEKSRDIDHEKRKLESRLLVAENVDTCVLCGAVIPEGRQICPICEHEIIDKATKAVFNHLQGDFTAL